MPPFDWRSSFDTPCDFSSKRYTWYLSIFPLMQISRSRTFAAIAIIVMMHMMISPLQKVCSAFTPSQTTTSSLVHRAQNAVRKSNMRLMYISSLSPLPSTQEHGSSNSFFSTQDLERELNRALDFARDMDKKYGLCTRPSQEAWDYVDDIYQKIQAYKDGSSSSSNEHHTSTAQGPQSSPGRNKMRVLMGSRNGPSEREMKGRRYFF